MSDDLITSLRALAAARHDDHSIAVDAVIEIERLRADLATQQGCCDGAAAQDAHIRQEREEHRAEVEKLRADNERLFNEDTKTRHALKGWVCVCPDGGDEPTHERVSAVVAEVERLRAEIKRLRADNERMHNVLYRIARKRPFVHNPWALARAEVEGKP